MKQFWCNKPMFYNILSSFHRYCDAITHSCTHDLVLTYMNRYKANTSNLYQHMLLTSGISCNQTLLLVPPLLILPLGYGQTSLRAWLSYFSCLYANQSPIKMVLHNEELCPALLLLASQCTSLKTSWEYTDPYGNVSISAFTN